MGFRVGFIVAFIDGFILGFPVVFKLMDISFNLRLINGPIFFAEIE